MTGLCKCSGGFDGMLGECALFLECILTFNKAQRKSLPERMYTRYNNRDIASWEG